MADSDRLRISRSADGQTIWLWRNGSTLTFSLEDWSAFCALQQEFNAGADRVQNFVDPPRERVPVAAAPVSAGKIASIDLADLFSK